MKALITRIGIVALLVCIWASGVMADDNYVYPPGAEPFDYGDGFPPELKTPSLYDEISVPDRALKSAYHEFKGTYLKADPILALNNLRMFVLRKRLDKVRENLEWAIAQGWDKDFIDLFRRSIEWGDHIWHSNGAYVWAQSKIEEDRSPHDSHMWVKRVLERVAIKKKYAPAQYEHIQRVYLTPTDQFFDVENARSTLSDLGERNYKPAIQQLIENFITGAHWPKHLGAAYFWFKRGEELGLDLSPWRPRIEKLVSEQDRAWAQSFRDQGEIPQPWDFK